MKTGKCLLVLLFVMVPSVCFAHFGMLIPSQSAADAQHKSLELDLSFSHPFEMLGMPMEKPEKFAVKVNGKTENLLSNLQQTKIMGQKAWKAGYTFKRPGVYSFYMQPKPYWEPAEDCFIIHYTKTIVPAFGAESGWDEQVGLKTEIVPLTRPFGLYAGNVFQGRVLMDGKPVPHAEVEIEYYNKNREAEAPNDYAITQVVKADADGIFTYAPPEEGWWGFAALNTADYTMKHEGKAKDVELGAVLWVKFLEWED
jgi:cobalt/nickel transport protein